jgi:maltose O-acetyltransferase
MGTIRKIWEIVLGELGVGSTNYRLLAVQLLIRLLPYGMALRTRTLLYRLGGVRIGSGSVIVGYVRLWGKQQLTIGCDTTINTPCAICLDAPVTIGDHVLIGHDVIIATGGHVLGTHVRRGGALNPLPVDIQNGVWIGTGAVILPGVTLGEGSIVAAGAAVAKSVPADTLVGGVPARRIRVLLDSTEDHSQDR